MAIHIFSIAPDGEKATDTASKLSDVKVIVQRLEAAGYQKIQVGPDEASALPFEQWVIAASGVRVEAQ